MYVLIKTHKVRNSVRVITIECGGTAIENLFIYLFFQKCLYSEVLKIERRVKDTSEMFTIINNLNNLK